MKFRIRALAVIAGLFLSATNASAAITHANVDFQTAGGPITTLGGSISAPVSNAFTVSGTAKNTSGLTYNDVRLLVQFMYTSTPAGPMTFNDGTDTWSYLTRSYNVVSPSGTFNMPDTDAPLSWTYTGTANLGTSDSVPYISIGTLGPGGTQPFSFVIQGTSSDNFEFVGSFVAAVPEPSTIVMFGLGGIAMFAARRRRRK